MSRNQICRDENVNMDSRFKVKITEKYIYLISRIYKLEYNTQCLSSIKIDGYQIGIKLNI